MLLALLSCTDPCAEGFARANDGSCQPLDDGTSKPGDSSPETDTGDPPDDTGDPPAATLEYGDPITRVGYVKEGFKEWMDAIVVSETRVLAAGVTGIGWYSIEGGTPELLYEDNPHRTYRLDLDTSTDRAYFASRDGPLIIVDDVAEDDPKYTDRVWLQDMGFHEDIAADGGVVMVGWLSDGLRIFDHDLQAITTIEAEMAFGVALEGDRGLYTDGSALILLDMSHAAEPVELDRTELRTIGRDIAFDGSRIAVALGGEGVDVFDLVDDELVKTGELEVPGSAFGVTLDGDWLWIGAWEVAALAWLGGEEPVIVGHEDPVQSAMGIGAKDGIVAVADWGAMTILQHQDGVGGPEFHDPSPVWIDPNTQETSELEFTNYGAMDMELQVSPTSGWELDEDSLVLAPGESGYLTMTPPIDVPELALFTVTTNDPDEEEITVQVQAKSTQAGSEHADFSLLGYTPPDTGTVETYTLSDYRGTVVLLDYFTTW